MKPIPRYTSEDNSAYDYYQGENNEYKTTIVLDELNDSLVIMPWHMPDVSESSKCTCKDFNYRQRKCKHMESLLRYLSSQYRIEYREEDKPITIKKEVGV
jgi:hypothetical protein